MNAWKRFKKTRQGGQRAREREDGTRPAWRLDEQAGEPAARLSAPPNTALSPRPIRRLFPPASSH